MFRVILKSKGDANDLFSFFSWCMEHPSVSAQQRDNINQQFVDHISEIIQIDPNQTVSTIVRYFYGQIHEIVSSLESFPQIQLQYLSSLIETSRNPTDLSEESKNALIAAIDSEVVEKYISLLCRYKRNEVYTYLVSTQNYNLEKIMLMVKNHKIYDAAAYLLERTGDLKGSLVLMLKMFQKGITKLDSALQNTPQDEDTKLNSLLRDMPEYFMVIKRLDIVTHLCERSSTRNDPEARLLWFSVLGNFLELRQLQLKSKSTQSASVILDCIRLFMLRMKDFLPIRDVIAYLSQQGSNMLLSDVRSTISQLIESITKDKQLAFSAAKVFESDISKGSLVLFRRQAKAYIPRADGCVTCGKPISETAIKSLAYRKMKKVIIYDCGHCYHAVSLNLLPCLKLNDCCSNVLQKDKHIVYRVGTLKRKYSLHWSH
jgi:hypothetical protein